MAYILGDDFNNSLFGTETDDVIGGKGGDDFIISRAGNDQIWDTLGNNTVYAGDGNDFVVTGSGNDIVYGNNDDDVIRTGHGDDHAHGGNGNDFITDLYGYNAISGGQGEDVIKFSASSHRIYDGDFGQSGDGARDEFILGSWHENTDLTLPNQKGDVLGSFEVGIDVINLAELGIQASSVTINPYDNGYMVEISQDGSETSFGVRTHATGALTMSDIITV